MFRSIVHQILERRHFWRVATFGEIADLYISRTLRLAAINIGTGFTSVYLYRQGYSLVFILLFWASVYTVRTLFAPVAGWLVANLGTAPSTMISNIIYIPAMIALGLMPELGLPAIIFFGVSLGISIVIYSLCYSVEFSVVKNPAHAGKELGFMNILEKIAISGSPVVGGLIALLFGPQVTMWVAGFLFAMAALPLFLNRPERAEKRQKISLVGFPWRVAMPSIMAQLSFGFDNAGSSIAWGLFVLIYVFPHYGNNIYVILGGLSSITVIVAMLASMTYGRIIDRRRGGELMRFGVAANALVHISRIFVKTPFDTVGVNVVNEAATTAQNMAYVRGEFDLADLSGHRIAYFIGVEFVYGFGVVLACLLLLALTVNINGPLAYQVFFAATAVMVLGINFARFPLYRK